MYLRGEVGVGTGWWAVGGEGYTHTHTEDRHTQTDRQTDRQTDTHTHRQTGTHTHTDRQTDRQTHTPTERHTHTHRQTDRQTDPHTQTDTNTQVRECQPLVNKSTSKINLKKKPYKGLKFFKQKGARTGKGQQPLVQS